MTADGLIQKLKSLADPNTVAEKAHYGINTHNTLGVPVAKIRPLAKGNHSHALALELWQSGIHEARILAALVDEPKQVTGEQMDSWTAEFDSWDVCDLVCMHLFVYTALAHEKALAWCRNEEEFFKRAGYVMMATLAVHDKKAGDEVFTAMLPEIRRAATDERNFVRKAVNWALRSIGKRNLALNTAAIQAAREIAKIESPTARWIAADALRELTGPAVQNRLNDPTRRRKSK